MNEHFCSEHVRINLHVYEINYTVAYHIPVTQTWEEATSICHLYMKGCACLYKQRQRNTAKILLFYC